MVPVGYNKTDYGRGENSFIAIARLKAGVTVTQARTEMETIAGRLYNSTNRRRGMAQL